MIASLLFLLTFAQADAAAKDLGKLQGEWSITEVTTDGETHAVKVRFKFNKDEISVEGDDDVKKDFGKFRITLDPSTMPPCIDVHVTVGNQKGVKMEGIYELKGDELKICLKLTGNERPREFAAPAGSSLTLITLKKEK